MDGPGKRVIFLALSVAQFDDWLFWRVDDFQHGGASPLHRLDGALALFT
jgi:hypothetical protein